jgi:hypothetical protein
MTDLTNFGIAMETAGLIAGLGIGFMAGVYYQFRRRIPEPGPEPTTPLTPGTCECGHFRCSHDGGSGRCGVGYPPDEKWTFGAMCACKIFIPDPDGDGEDDDETPSPQDLEKNQDICDCGINSLVSRIDAALEGKS